jgi:hypothetical protein
MITVGITAGGLLTAFGLYKAARCIYDSSSYRYSRDAHKKYDPLTQALAENDAALLVEIEKLGKGVELPQELMCMILEKHHTKKNFVVNGKPAPGIRFFDTEARKDARAAALQAAWNQIKSERATARNNARLLDDDSDSERFGLNENDILLVNMQK